DEVVLVVTGDGDDDIGATRPSGFQDRGLGAVPLHDDGTEALGVDLALDRVLLDQEDLVPLVDQGLCEVVADLPAPNDDDVHVVAPVPACAPGASPVATPRPPGPVPRSDRERSSSGRKL